MPTKDKAKQRAWCRDHYRRNKKKYLQKNRKRYKMLRAWLDSIKDVPCMDCKRRFPPCAMEFDHVRGKKKFEISTGLVSRSLEAVKKEMAKCDIVCANCHKIRTFAPR